MNSASQQQFLNGGGEMGARMRAFDWRNTPLGPPEMWPQSLKTIVRVMLDSRFAMWMSWGPDGTFFCNEAYLPTVGIKRDWVLGARADTVWAEIWHDIAPRIEQVLTTGIATWDEGLQLFLQRSGYPEETFHTFSYSPVYDDNSQIAGMLCVVVEDTGRAIGERRLHLLRELAALSIREARSLDDAAAPLIACLERGVEDAPFAALYLPSELSEEPGALRLAGQTGNVGIGVLPAVVSLDGPDGPLPFNAAERMGSLQGVGDLAQKFGAIKGAWDEPVEQACVLPLLVSGQARALGALVVGVSTRRRLDDDYRSFLALVASQVASRLAETKVHLEERQKAQALAELDRAKNVFFSNVSHEFRTPLTLMLGPVEDMLAQPDLVPALQEPLRLVHRNGQRLRKLVNSLLDFSRIEAGRVEASFHATDLAALTRDLASAFRSAIESAGLRFVVDCEPLPSSVYVDVDMWEKVVLNLLSNAFKHTFEGEISVALTLLGDTAQLKVSDSGIGIHAEALAQLFDRFHRVAGARSRSHEGTGIGLALVKELVKLHGGNVTVDSAPGRGSCFTVTVPLGRAHLPAHRISDDAAELPSAKQLTPDLLFDEAPSAALGLASAAIEPRSGRHVSVLVVDDNADMRAYISGMLSPYWQVDTAADGLLALAAIERRRPDVIVSDIMMPNLDGYGLLQRIRAGDETRALPVILLSAQAGEEARLEGLGKGADDYLVKPFSSRELVARVEVLLVREQMHAIRDTVNRRLVDVFDNAPVAVALLEGPRHVFAYANEDYRRLVGQRDLVGKPVLDALPELVGQGVQELLDGVLRSGQPHFAKAFAVQLLDPITGHNEERYLDFVYQPLDSTDGGPPGTIAVVCFEVTEQLKARQKVEDASRAKDEFLAMLGHELRNPLAPIQTALHLMRQRADGTDLKERSIIERQVKHMVRLVDDLLDVARIARGHIELQRSEIQLASVVAQAVETVSPLFEHKRQPLEIHVEAMLPLHGDAIRLVQILSNLLTNASKFSEPGQHVRLDARRDGDDALLTVSDEGLGMAADELAVVFESFVQGRRQALHRPHGGLGLGLAIARNLAELHGGALTAESAGAGHGSVFSLRLPLHQPALQTASSGINGATAQPDGGDGRRVLIVDDNEDAAETLQMLLEAMGHRPVVAHDGPSALRLLEQQAVDVIVLDIGLPGMSGYELAQHIRARADAAALRLIALTGYGQAEDRARSAAHGIDAHLVKPVDLDTLLELIG